MSMTTIKTITPVHVGTGQMLQIPSFQRHGSKLYRYDYSEVLSTLPVRTMLDKRFLADLSSRQPSKPKLYQRILREANHDFLKPKYEIFWHQECDGCKGNIGQLRSDIDEQVKEMGKPYIPGSSLKGAIENAFKYYILEYILKNSSNPKRTLQRFLQRTAFNKGKIKEGFLLELAPASSCSKNKDISNDDFFKDLYSCLSVSDVYFENMEIYISELENIYNSKPVNVSVVEAIQQGQTAAVDNLIAIDPDRLSWLKGKYQKGEFEYSICNLFTVENLIKMCNRYTYEVIQTDKAEAVKELYAEFDGEDLNGFIQNLEKEIKQCYQTTNECILRIGRNTDYFFKSLSLIVKKNYPDLYEEYFEIVFSPVSIRKGKKNNPKPSEMPVTRTLYFNDEGIWLPGFIKIHL